MAIEILPAFIKGVLRLSVTIDADVAKSYTDGVVTIMGPDKRCTHHPVDAESCPDCGGSGNAVCQACNDSGVNRGGGDCQNCAPYPPQCGACGGKGKSDSTEAFGVDIIARK